MKLDTSKMTPLQLGRLNKCLSVRYNFSEGVYTLKSYIFKFGKGKKISNVLKRTGNIKKEYSLITDLEKEITIEIPKIVYDCLTFQ